MMPIGSVWENVQNSLRLMDDETLAIIKRRCNAAYYRLCELTCWQRLRRSASIVFDGVNGAILPADLIGIMAVVDSDGNELAATEENSQGESYPCFAWYYQHAAVEPLRVEKGLTILKDATTISTTTALTAAMVGEYLRIASEPGFYKIASATTISTAYRGDAQTRVIYVVRPPTTRTIAMVDEEGDLYAGTYAVHYWAYPEPLFQEWQTPLLPSVRALELATLVDILGTMDKQEKIADTYRAELREEISRMQNQNPRFVRPTPMMAHDGSRVRFGWRD
jgi:hypothetical protein